MYLSGKGTRADARLFIFLYGNDRTMLLQLILEPTLSKILSFVTFRKNNEILPCIYTLYIYEEMAV